MSAAEILEQIARLPWEEQREVFERLCEQFDDGLTPEQAAELDRRAEEALKHPERGIPVEQVFAEISRSTRTSARSESSPSGTPPGIRRTSSAG